MKKSEITQILGNLREKNEAIVMLHKYSTDLTHARALVRSIIYEKYYEHIDECAELLTAMSGIHISAIVRRYAAMIKLANSRYYKNQTNKDKIVAAVRQLDKYVTNIKNNTAGVLAKMCVLMSALQTARSDDKKKEAIAALVAEIDGYEDRLKLSVIRQKFNTVLTLIEKYGIDPAAAEEVTEETQTNAPEAPEIALTASSDVQMSNVSTDAKERGEDAENAPGTQLEHTDLLADDTAGDAMGDVPGEMQKVA